MSLARKITHIIDALYIYPFSKLMPRQTFLYAACGGGNMVLNWVLYYLVFHYVVCEKIVELGFVAISAHIASMLIVFPVTFLTGFWLQRNVAFKLSPLRGRVQLLRYLLSVAGSLVLNKYILDLFVEVLNIYPTPSQVLTSLVVTVYSYLMQKYFTFRGSEA